MTGTPGVATGEVLTDGLCVALGVGEGRGVWIAPGAGVRLATMFAFDVCDGRVLFDIESSEDKVFENEVLFVAGGGIAGAGSLYAMSAGPLKL